MQNFAFNPSTLSIAVGTKVTVINKDSVDHTWTADGGQFDSGELAQNQSYSFTFNSPGAFPYHCSMHPSMTGTVQVT
ncbi:MAG TPA: cupredoxin family copper-binding protein [Acidimicrobiales bacterium]|nr:cupredoxin family copper-binding protein [Acidimicrobiales bacterium]